MLGLNTGRYYDKYDISLNILDTQSLQKLAQILRALTIRINFKSFTPPPVQKPSNLMSIGLLHIPICKA